MVFITDRITISPDLCNGKPTIRGKRITVQTILEFIFAGDSTAEILDNYPSLEAADLEACKKFALEMMDRQFTVQKIERKAA